jgi:hypothetical protein
LCIAHHPLLAKYRCVRSLIQEKSMKALIATAILVVAIASPALAQRAQSAPQRGYQAQQNGSYNGYPVQEWYHDDAW